MTRALGAGDPALTDQGYRILGSVVIVILYAVIGLMATAGGLLSSLGKILAPKAEQIFYASFLIMTAAFYLAFASLFRSGDGVVTGNSCGRWGSPQ